MNNDSNQIDHDTGNSTSYSVSGQFYCTGVIVYNKLDNYFVVSADRQTFLGFKMTANFRDTSPLSQTRRPEDDEPDRNGFILSCLNLYLPFNNDLMISVLTD